MSSRKHLTVFWRAYRYSCCYHSVGMKCALFDFSIADKSQSVRASLMDLLSPFFTGMLTFFMMNCNYCDCLGLNIFLDDLFSIFISQFEKNLP